MRALKNRVTQLNNEVAAIVITPIHSKSVTAIIGRCDGTVFVFVAFTYWVEINVSS